MTNPQPWHTLTPDQQRQAWAQHYARQEVVPDLEQAARRRHTTTAMWLLLGVPGLILGLIILSAFLNAILT